MKAWTRWQEWVNLVVGAWVFISPWILGFSQDPASSWSAWVLGVLLVVVALWALAAPFSTAAVWIVGALGVLVFLSPWVLGFAGLANPAWSAWITGVVVAVAAVWDLVQPRGAGSQIA